MSEQIEKLFSRLDEEIKQAIESELASLQAEEEAQIKLEADKEKEYMDIFADTGITKDKLDQLDKAAVTRIDEALKNVEAKPLEYKKDAKLVTAREVSLARGMLFPSSIVKRLTPPAYSCGGFPSGDAACVRLLGECNPRAYVKGSGWYGKRTKTVIGYCWWLYVPPKNGALYIDPRWSVHGAYHLYSDDRWWSSSWASINLKLMTNVYQWYWDGWDTDTVLNIYDDEINVYRRFDRGYTQNKSLHVTANKPVWILTEFQLRCRAKSKYAHCLADFRTGVNNYIKVPWIWTYLI